MDKEAIKRLYLLQVRGSGIDNDAYQQLPRAEQKRLELVQGRHYLQESERKKIRVAMTGGAFDVLHLGHLYVLNETKRQADVLVVSVASDDLVRQRKGRLLHSQEDRARLVEALKPVDLALCGGRSPEETYRRVKPDLIVYGYDQKPFLQPDGVEIVQLGEHQPEKFKTSRIVRELGL